MKKSLSSSDQDVTMYVQLHGSLPCDIMTQFKHSHTHTHVLLRQSFQEGRLLVIVHTTIILICPILFFVPTMHNLLN